MGLKTFPVGKPMSIATHLSEADQANLTRADQVWFRLKHSTGKDSHPVIYEDPTQLDGVDWDVVICGGTLGIFMGAVLAKRGWRVALIERGQLRGRQQEWNISRHELQVLLDLGLLTEPELDQIMVTHYNPARLGFLGSPDFWVRDILNIGVDPVQLLELLKQQFLKAGGSLLESSTFESATIHPDGIEIQAGTRLSSRLMLDAMGYFSPVVQQARHGQKPEGVCLVVGSCAKGLPDLTTGDLLYTFTPIQHQCQYFWEAFPARDGRTTYLFTYVDADPARISLTMLFEDYLRLLPTYQSVELDQIHFQRILFGCFPAYRQSPFQSPWNRILAIGDSSGCQSPLSFGGFGAMLRHLKRLDQGIHEALQADAMTSRDLALLQPYQPNLSVTWLFQKAMSVEVSSHPDPNQINTLLAKVFSTMMNLGEPVVKPFLQDVVQFPGLLQTLSTLSLSDPGLVAQLVPELGFMPLLTWIKHFSALGLYTGLYPIGKQLDSVFTSNPEQPHYYWHQWLRALSYGAGQDNQS